MGMESFDFKETIKSPENEPLLTFTFFDKTESENIKEIPFSCSAIDIEGAYTAYVIWCLEQKIKPKERSILSINSISKK